MMSLEERGNLKIEKKNLTNLITDWSFLGPFNQVQKELKTKY